jgi:hypothetical protein
LIHRPQTRVGEPVISGHVSFEIKTIQAYIDSQSSRENREDLRKAAQALARAGEPPDLRQIVRDYYEEVGGVLRELRKALIEAWTSAGQRPLREWSEDPSAWPDADVR